MGLQGNSECSNFLFFYLSFLGNSFHLSKSLNLMLSSFVFSVFPCVVSSLRIMIRERF